MTKYRTCVYIDGFNLYYAAVVDKPRLNIRYPSLRALCLNKLKSFPDQAHTLEEIHYFTARVIPPDYDKDKGGRQNRYNIALAKEQVNAKEKVKVHYGEFVKRKNSSGNGVWKEKQSDVNLATYFVHGAYPYPDTTQGYDYAVIISNDTDFCGTIKFVLKKFPQKMVDIWTVEGHTLARDLEDMTGRYANMWHHEITEADLKNAPQIANKDYTAQRI